MGRPRNTRQPKIRLHPTQTGWFNDKVEYYHPVESYWELKKDEEKPDFVKHTRELELLHNMKPIGDHDRRTGS